MDAINLFKLPKEAIDERRIPVKDIVAALNLSGRDKTSFEKSIKSIHLIANINEDTTDIWSFKDETYYYGAIYFIKIELKNILRIKLINELIQRVFPNPIIAIYEYGNKSAISSAMKRINKVDNTKSVIDAIQLTDFFFADENIIKLFKNINYSFKNLKDLYEHFDNIISGYFVLKINGTIPDEIDSSLKVKSLAIQNLLKERSELEGGLKKAVSVREKIELNSKIKYIDKKLESIK